MWLMRRFHHVQSSWCEWTCRGCRVTRTCEHQSSLSVPENEKNTCHYQQYMWSKICCNLFHPWINHEERKILCLYLQAPVIEIKYFYSGSIYLETNITKKKKIEFFFFINFNICTCIKKKTKKNPTKLLIFGEHTLLIEKNRKIYLWKIKCHKNQKLINLFCDVCFLKFLSYTDMLQHNNQKVYFCMLNGFFTQDHYVWFIWSEQ